MRRYSNKPLTERQTNHDDTVSVILPASTTITPGVTNTRTVVRKPGAATDSRRYGYHAPVTVSPFANNQLSIQMRVAAPVVVAAVEEAAEPGWGPWDDGALLPSINWFDEEHQVMQIAPTGAVLFVGYQSSDNDYAYLIFPAGDLSTPALNEIAIPGGWSSFLPIIAAPWNGTDDPITTALTDPGETFLVPGVYLPGTGFHAYISGHNLTGYDAALTNNHIVLDSAGNRHALVNGNERFSPNESSVLYSKNEGTAVKIHGSGNNAYAEGIAVDKNDDNNIVMWFASNDTGDNEYYEAHSDDNGATWSTPVVVTPFENNNTFMDGFKQFHVLLGGNGVFLMSAPLDPYNDLVYIYSSDGGATWSSEVSHSMPTPNWGGGWQGSVSPDGNYFALWEAGRSSGKVRCMLLQWTGSAFDVIVDKFEVFGNVDFTDPGVFSWRAIHMQPTDAGGLHVALWILRTGDFKEIIHRRVYTPA